MMKIICLGQTVQKMMSNQPMEVAFKTRQSGLWQVFLKRDETGRYHTFDKRKILEKLDEKQNILIPSIKEIDGKLFLGKVRLYSFSKAYQKDEYLFSINMYPIACPSQNYFYMNVDELRLENIGSCVNKYLKEKCKDENYKRIEKIFPKLFCMSAIIKLNILLKYKYNRNNNFVSGKYLGNFCTIYAHELNESLGYINSEVVRILYANNYIKDRKDPRGEVFTLLRHYVLECIFWCAKELKWIVSLPKPNDKTQCWGFNLNRYYFDKKKTLTDFKALPKSN